MALIACAIAAPATAADVAPVAVSSAVMDAVVADESSGPRAVYEARDGSLEATGLACTVTAHGMGCVDAETGAFDYGIEEDWVLSPVPAGDLLDAGQSGWFVLVGNSAVPLSATAASVAGGEVTVEQAVELARYVGYSPFAAGVGQWWPLAAGGVLALTLVGLAARRRRHRAGPEPA